MEKFTSSLNKQAQTQAFIDRYTGGFSSCIANAIAIDQNKNDSVVSSKNNKTVTKFLSVQEELIRNSSIPYFSRDIFTAFMDIRELINIAYALPLIAHNKTFENIHLLIETYEQLFIYLKGKNNKIDQKTDQQIYNEMRFRGYEQILYMKNDFIKWEEKHNTIISQDVGEGFGNFKKLYLECLNSALQKVWGYK